MKDIFTEGFFSLKEKYFVLKLLSNFNYVWNSYCGFVPSI